MKTNTFSCPSKPSNGLLMTPGTLTFFGHTHMQGGFVFRDAELDTIAIRPPRARQPCFPLCPSSPARATC